MNNEKINFQRVTVKGGLKSYRSCDKVWTLIIEDGVYETRFGINKRIFKCDKVKIVACEAKENPK